MSSYIGHDRAIILDQPGLVDLYRLSLSEGDEIRFVNDSRSDGHVSFNGETYNCVPITASGFVWGPLSHRNLPRLTLPTTAGNFQLSENSDKLIGAICKRIITLQTELDAPVGTGGGSCFAPESWEVLRIIRMDSYTAELELGPPALLLGSHLPNHQILRDICQHRYRIWDSEAGKFDYSLATCPYQSDSYFDDAGKSTNDPAADSCSRHLHSGCRKRFTSSLPFFGFPGAAS